MYAHATSHTFPNCGISLDSRTLPASEATDCVELILLYYKIYGIRRVQVNQDGLKLNGTHQLLVYADDVNMLRGSVHTIKENVEALVVASKETGLEVKMRVEPSTWSCLETRMQDEVTL